MRNEDALENLPKNAANLNSLIRTRVIFLVQIAYSIYPGLPVCRHIPSVIEYLSYMFNFTSILSGPAFNLVDYQRFIDGTDKISADVSLVY